MSPTYDEALSATQTILKKHVAEGRSIEPGHHIQNDLGLDSLGVMEVISDIEERFDVAIPTELLDKLATVQDVAQALVKLKS